MNKFIGTIILWTLCVCGYATEMPFPQVERGKLLLREKDSPYILEQGIILTSTDTLIIEPGVVVFMGEYAKMMLRGPVKILGTESKPVVFRSADSSESWNGLHFISSSIPFEVKNLIVENAFRNSVFRSRGIFENVKFINNYYGLWVDDVKELLLAKCEFFRNRFALSIRGGKVQGVSSKIYNNVYGLFLEVGGDFLNENSEIKGNLESDIRNESDELSKNKKRVSRSVWQRIEAGF